MVLVVCEYGGLVGCFFFFVIFWVLRWLLSVGLMVFVRCEFIGLYMWLLVLFGYLRVCFDMFLLGYYCCLGFLVCFQSCCVYFWV